MKLLTIVSFVLLGFSMMTHAAPIKKTQIKFGDSKDIKLDARSATCDEFSKNDKLLLKEFVSLPAAQVGVIACSEHNLSFIEDTLKKINPNFNFFVRYYDDLPWILNKKAADNLPNPKDGLLHGALTVLTIEPKKNDIRVVLVKDNKSYIMNNAGTKEDVDKEEVDTAKRELKEELRLENLNDHDFLRLGEFKCLRKNKLLDIEWEGITTAFTYHLDVKETNQWLQKIEINTLSDDAVIAHKFLNDEVEWIFFVKPQEFKEKNLRFPIGKKRAVVFSHHADISSVVLKGKFNKSVVLVGRNVNYLDGKVAYGAITATFIKKPN